MVIYNSQFYHSGEGAGKEVMYGVDRERAPANIQPLSAVADS